jgi:PII-like signaling protein
MGEYTNEKTLLRIYICEDDRYGDKALFEALVDIFGSEGYAEATVLKGIAGFGAQCGQRRGAHLERSRPLPVVVEVISCRARIDWIMPRICGMMNRGMITLGTVKVARNCKNINRQEMLKELKKMAH